VKNNRRSLFDTHPDKVYLMAEQISNGKTARQIAATVGCCHTYVRRKTAQYFPDLVSVLRENGERYGATSRGRRKNSGRVTSTEQVRAWLAEGHTVNSIACLVRCSPQTVRNYLNGFHEKRRKCTSPLTRE
jgi:DNA-binding CsgD family transcriptional regulator